MYPSTSHPQKWYYEDDSDTLLTTTTNGGGTAAFAKSLRERFPLGYHDSNGKSTVTLLAVATKTAIFITVMTRVPENRPL